MKRNKTFALILAVVLLLAVSVGGTLAYLSTKTEPVTNRFEPAYVRCEVNDNLTVTNKSNVNAYIRAAVVVNWMYQDSEGKVYVYGEAPKYTLTAGEDWTYDGKYFYYEKELTPTGDTATAPAPATVNPDAGSEAPPSGYSLSVEVVAEAIQAEGMGAKDAQDAWSIAMSGS